MKLNYTRQPVTLAKRDVGVGRRCGVSIRQTQARWRTSDGWSARSSAPTQRSLPRILIRAELPSMNEWMDLSDGDENTANCRPGNPRTRIYRST